jgi:hypothetical protein
MRSAICLHHQPGRNLGIVCRHADVVTAENVTDRIERAAVVKHVSCARVARIIIMRPEITLHLEAGYIFADCSRPNRFFLQSGGGPHMLRQRQAYLVMNARVCYLY